MVRFASRKDVPMIMQFIATHWASDHIFAHSLELFLFQHGAPDNDKVNFVLAFNADDELIGILGFITTSKFDPALAGGASDVLWLTLWKSQENASSAVGLQLLSFLQRAVPHRWIGTIGTTTLADQIYKALGFSVGTMDQHYLCNPDFAQFKVGKNLLVIKDNCNVEQFSLVEVDSKKLLTLDSNEKNQRPTTHRYLAAKYGFHPVYEYKFLYSSTLNITFVIRKIQVDGRNVLRVIDACGDLTTLPHFKKTLTTYLLQQDSEYLDIVSYGLCSTVLKHAGFVSSQASSDTIVPNYFEPFEQRNVALRFAMKHYSIDDFILLKGDADQDRPSRIAGVNL